MSAFDSTFPFFDVRLETCILLDIIEGGDEIIFSGGKKTKAVIKRFSDENGRIDT